LPEPFGRPRPRLTEVSSAAGLASTGLSELSELSAILPILYRAIMNDCKDNLNNRKVFFAYMIVPLAADWYKAAMPVARKQPSRDHSAGRKPEHTGRTASAVGGLRIVRCRHNRSFFLFFLALHKGYVYKAGMKCSKGQFNEPTCPGENSNILGAFHRQRAASGSLVVVKRRACERPMIPLKRVDMAATLLLRVAVIFPRRASLYLWRQFFPSPSVRHPSDDAQPMVAAGL